MPAQNLAVANSLLGVLDGRRAFELPGVLIDLSTYEPLLFGVNPTTMQNTKTLIAADHIIPGRHAPLQEPVSGGPEVLKLDLLFLGTSALALAATKQAVRWLESLMFPDRGGVGGAIANALTGSFDRSQNFVAEVGHRVNLTYGLWIIEQPYLLRSISTVSGPGQDPITLLPYRAKCTLTLQEDRTENTDYLERRWGLPSFS